ncbi:hypothetical protein C0993_000332 [Termitomyces sp. T159_Od127]|nr:hypothetical protein C0993_000332 [Termitomyces sp. T159_Od127]
MSDPTTFCPTLSANPDVSGIGVRTAIYVQNLLSFVPALWAIKDGRMTPTKLDELEKQSTTILITAFAILIATIIQAHNQGISNYHASIILDLSWMNNTNLFIYFLLYIHYRVNLSEDELSEEVRVSVSHALLKNRIRSLSRWIYEIKKASKNSVVLIGSLHLSLMAAVGIWLWSYPADFGGSETLAVLLLLVALRDLIESILERRAKQLDEQLLEASKKGEQNSVASLLRQGARSNVIGMNLMFLMGMLLTVFD